MTLGRRWVVWPAVGVPAVFGLLWLLTAYASPLNPWLLRRVAAWGRRHGPPALSWSCERAGFGGGLGHLRIRGLNAGAPRLDDLVVESLDVRFRVRDLMRRRLSLVSVEVRGLHLRATLDLEAGKGFPPIPEAFDLDNLPAVVVDPMHVALTLLHASTGDPVRLALADAVVHAGTARSPERGPSYEWVFEANLAVNDGEPAALRCAGFVDPRALHPDNVNLDAEMVLRDLALRDVTAARPRVMPFLADDGRMTLHLDLCSRHGRLSGLASLRINGMLIQPNPEAERGRFLTLSFRAWNTLARQRNGTVEADADIGGTARAPVVPFGPVLRQQLGGIAHSLAARMLGALPSEATRERAGRMEASREAAGRHDDILKIARLPPHERHYERGRHYERIVRAYPRAVEEYRHQVDRYPAETNLAVQALLRSAELCQRRLDEPREAMADLRRILDAYPRDRHADGALYQKIRIAEGIRDFPRAQALCREFLERFPSSAHARAARAAQDRIRAYVW